MKEPIALVTGARSGIGKALARTLAEDGYQLAVVSRSRKKLTPFCEEFGAVALEADLETDQGAHELVENFRAEFGRLDVLVNSAGVLHRGLYELSPQQFEQMWRLNVRAPFLLTQGLIPMMESRGYGHIFNVSSRSGKVGFPGAGGYSSSKFALSGLNEATYRGYAESGIKVTALCPSWVDTPMARHGKCPLPPEERIPTADLSATVRWLLGLSPVSCVKEVVIECRNDIF